MKSVALTGNKRTEVGSSQLKSLRKNNLVPCVVYGGKDNTHLTIKEVDFEKIINSPEVYFVDLDIDGTKVKTIIKDVQFHPVTDRVLHVDFLVVTEDKPVKVALPIKVKGNAKGVIAGGKLRLVSRKLKVSGLAKDLPDAIEIDISKLAIGQSIKVGELSVDGITFLDAANAVVVAVKMSRAAVSATEEEEEEEAEGEEATTEEAAAE